MRSDDGAAVLVLCRVLGLRIRFIHQVGDADCLAPSNCLAQSGELEHAQEPLASSFGIFFDPADGVGAQRNNLSLLCERVEAPHNREHPVGLVRMLLHD